MLRPPPSPVMILSRWIENAFHVPVHRTHHSNPRKHRSPAALCNEKQSFHRGLPFYGIVFCFWQFSDVVRGVAERDQRLTLR
jgi:hypothetical protein